MSDNISGTDVLLIGAGPMAQAYAQVLKAIGANFTVIGRGTKSAEAFETVIGIKPKTEGLDHFMRTHPADFDKAIIATGVESLRQVASQLVKWGIKEILVEKPGALNISEVNALYEETKHLPVRILVAYNRRFYAAVQRLREIIVEDGGVTSFNFEFTEWAHVIEPLQRLPGVKDNWFFLNSTHVVDTAFFLGGHPVEMATYTTGQLSWHPVSVFAGAGISDKGALFSYQANWSSAGRWGVEILTPKHRLYLRPMEKLQIQDVGSIEIRPVEIDDELDIEFKPGIYRQVKAFLAGDYTDMLSLEHQILHCAFYTEMLNTGRYNK